MSYDARVFTVLVASPGDVQEERQAIADIIHEWNNLNSRDRSIVLLPLRWETHAHPEMGAEPQSIINRQIVNECDMAVGVFWTRLGTPTATAESGSAEEISRVGESGKPVMMYFSNAPVPPRDLDLNELARLREYRTQHYPQGLIEQYSSIQEFRDKFTRQMSAKIMEMAANDAKRQSAEAETTGDTIEGVELLALSVVRGPDRTDLDNPVVIRRVICIDREKVPDYVDSTPTQMRPVAIGTPRIEYGPLIIQSGQNVNYYRRLVEYIEKMSTQLHFSFGLETFHSAVRDVHVQMRMTTDGSLSLSASPSYIPPSKEMSGYVINYGDSTAQVPGSFELSRVSRGEWELEFDIPVVQVGRTVFSPPIYTYVNGNSNLRCEATIYSSESKPFLLTRAIELQVEADEESYIEILKKFEA